MSDLVERQHEPIRYPILNGCLIFTAIAVALIVLMYFVLSQKINREAEERIMTALTSHYAPSDVEIIDRDNFKPDGDSWMFGAQICFSVRVRQSDHPLSLLRVAMIQGDTDGGSFSFGGEYPSMQQCKSKYNRG